MRSADDIDTIAIRHDGQRWVQAEHIPASDEPKWTKDKIQLISRLLNNPKGYKELVDQLSMLIGKGSTTAKRMIKNWIDDGSIIKDGDLYKQKAGF